MQNTEPNRAYGIYRSDDKQKRGSTKTFDNRCVPIIQQKGQHDLGLCGTDQIGWERQGVQTHHQVFRVRKNTSQTIRHNLRKGIRKE